MLQKSQQIHRLYRLENRGLVAKILGQDFANILEEAGQSEAPSLTGSDTAEAELFLLLQNMDKHLLELCLRETPE